MPHAYHVTHDAACDQRLSCMAALARGLIHELNNANGAILNNCAYIQTLDQPPAIAANILHIQRSAQRLVELTSILQLYTRDTVVPVEAVNLQTIVREACDTIRPDVEADPNDFSVELMAPSGNLYALSNPDLLTKALLALLRNAQEASTANSSPICVAIHQPPAPSLPKPSLSLGCRGTHSQYLSVQISDSGTGIPPEARCHIFDPFFSTKMRARGIGFAYVVGLVTHTNALVHILSAPDKGTTIQLLLPSAK